MLIVLYKRYHFSGDTMSRFKKQNQIPDHRELGKSLGMFFFDESAPGIPYWLPQGVIVKNLIFDLWRQMNRLEQYQEIASPLLNKERLWSRSGHLDHYKQDMFAFKPDDENGEPWYLKPMNCANAMVVWEHRQRSYKELPLRLADCDALHRNEASGALLGLLRSRCFCQDDSHNFVSSEQVHQELLAIIKMAKKFYSFFGLHEQMRFFFSSRPDSFMGEAHEWDRAEEQIQAALKECVGKYGEKPKEGSFYAPKIDIHFNDAHGREWQCGSLQLDYQIPKKFGLKYKEAHGGEACPVVIHKVIYGSVERFLGILLEHGDGWLPLWCSPCQVVVIPVSDKHAARAEEVAVLLRQKELQQPLRHNYLRVKVDARGESVARKVKDGEQQRIPIIIIIGDKELESNLVAIRIRSELLNVALNEFDAVIQRFSP